MTEQPNFYVVTLRGDRGPLSRQDLSEQLRAGEIAASDRVRNAFGRPLGTVAEVLGTEHAPRPAAPRPAPRPEATRRPAAPARPGIPPMAIAAAVGLLVVAVIAVIAVSSSSGAPPAVPQPAAPPVMAPKSETVRAAPSPSPAPAPARAAVVQEPKPGLQLDLYRLEEGSVAFPVFAATTKPDWSGVVSAVTHEICEEHGFHENFYARWSGSFDLLKAGDYEFFLFSDDGSRLFIDGKLVVDNGGLHGGQERSGRCTLAAGLHPVRIEYFQGNGPLVLRMQWQPAGFQRDEVSSTVFVH